MLPKFFEGSRNVYPIEQPAEIGRYPLQSANFRTAFLFKDNVKTNQIMYRIPIISYIILFSPNE
jgi:hypothetical protein